MPTKQDPPAPRRYSSVRIPYELLRAYRIAAAPIDTTAGALMLKVLAQHATKLQNNRGGTP